MELVLLWLIALKLLFDSTSPWVKGIQARKIAKDLTQPSGYKGWIYIAEERLFLKKKHFEVLRTTVDNQNYWKTEAIKWTSKGWEHSDILVYEHPAGSGEPIRPEQITDEFIHKIREQDRLSSLWLYSLSRAWVAVPLHYWHRIRDYDLALPYLPTVDITDW